MSSAVLRQFGGNHAHDPDNPRNTVVRGYVGVKITRMWSVATSFVRAARTAAPTLPTMAAPSFFERLADADRDRVLQIGVRRRYKRGDYVFHAGDTGDRLYVIVTGRVSVQLVNGEGDTTILALLGPGDCFGELALLRDGVRTASVVALEALEAVTLSRADLNQLRDDGRVVQGFLIDVLTAQVLRLTRRVIDAEFAPASHRIVARLAEVARVYNDGVLPVVVPMTQASLAGMAGTTRPTVNKVLSGLAADGLIRITRGGVDVLDLSGLQWRADTPLSR